MWAEDGTRRTALRELMTSALVSVPRISAPDDCDCERRHMAGRIATEPRADAAPRLRIVCALLAISLGHRYRDTRDRAMAFSFQKWGWGKGARGRRTIESIAYDDWIYGAEYSTQQKLPSGFVAFAAWSDEVVSV